MPARESYNEVVLLQQFSEGNAEAFRQLYAEHHETVFAFAFYMTKSKDVAEDITQEVFMKLWEKRQQIVIEKNFGQYIRKATQNMVLNSFRNTKNDPVRFNEFFRDMTDLRNTSEEPLLEKELNKAYVEAISLLTPGQRKVYLLKRDEELSYQEIAEQLGISVNTVRNHLIEANKHIREHIRKHPGLTAVIIALYYMKGM